MHVEALDSATVCHHCGAPALSEGMLIISVSELLELAVRVIYNEKSPF